ncbi:RluA family pseudouridine synthase [uncultured Ruminococcus sp.]|uniref:RluA family pseudouridine synthase n=1 Tax=uncultured Ruminococcus sp. TaxID=165186 RepID=UPI0025F9360B|nr:RluA family pseudouridine synthase [uncultured Ruminococcus sp.]
MSEKLEFIVPEEYDGKKAIAFLRKYCNLSARMITQLKRKKDGILMNGKILRTVDLTQAGNKVEINLPDEESEIVPVEGNLDIVFEDEHILVVNKPYSMPVHPVKQHQTNTLANIVTYYMKSRGENYVFRAVNRLDKDTSGLVLIAKNKFCANALKNKVSKNYFALCHGKLECGGTISAPIGLKEDSKIVRNVLDSGTVAITHYEVICSDDNISFLKLWLETGKTHQIRCHMSSIGHPLLGDDLYGGSLELISRQTLHCGEMTFVHPVNRKEISVSCKLPEDMQKILYTIKK